MARSILYSSISRLSASSNPTTFRIQTRHYETARRARKALTAAPAPSFTGIPGPHTTGGTGRSRLGKHLLNPANRREQDHIIFNPPPSAPNVYHTPYKFLPPDDVRRRYLQTLRAKQGLKTDGRLDEADVAKLPPALKQPYEKSYHVTAAQVQEMKDLRKQDESRWTVGKLAEKYQCSHLFVSMCCGPPSKDRLKRLEKKVEERRSAWGPRRRAARYESKRRRDAWSRDE